MRDPASSQAARRVLKVHPDPIDLRDLVYRPAIQRAPPERLWPKFTPRIRDQKSTNACTGFALASVVEILLTRARRKITKRVSASMLYSMARRYDEFPGETDEGSSLRGALKGWQKHGASSATLWPDGHDMPPVPDEVEADWWLDAVNRPLGAYYRIECQQLIDLQTALDEVGVLFASAAAHDGWQAGFTARAPARKARGFTKGFFRIEQQRTRRPAGHAFAIVGYDETGFLVQNSWGRKWGWHGFGILTYEDWRANAMDCWVAQLGVVTREHHAIAQSSTLRLDESGAHVELATAPILRQREIAPLVINMGAEGLLSNSGVFRTTPDDVRAIVDVHMKIARDRWQLGAKPMDLCIYAHGGLVGEKAAARVASEWIPLLYDRRIFPVFLMWESDLLTTLLEQAPSASDRAGAGLLSELERWWNERLEALIARPGTALWGKMKAKAAAIGNDPASGAGLFLKQLRQLKTRIRLHLVGHSAGCILHAHLLDGNANDIKIESLNYMAPALRAVDFENLVLPRLVDGRVRRYQHFMLTEKAEEDDPSCFPYGRSLLHLVSRSFEGGGETPIVGMQKHWTPFQDRHQSVLKSAAIHIAPGATSASTRHGGFDDDSATRARVIAAILGA